MASCSFDRKVYAGKCKRCTAITVKDVKKLYFLMDNVKLTGGIRESERNVVERC